MLVADPTHLQADRLLLLREVAEEARCFKLGGEDKIRVAGMTCENVRPQSLDSEPVVDSSPVQIISNTTHLDLILSRLETHRPSLALPTSLLPASYQTRPPSGTTSLSTSIYEAQHPGRHPSSHYAGSRVTGAGAGSGPAGMGGATRRQHAGSGRSVAGGPRGGLSAAAAAAAADLAAFAIGDRDPPRRKQPKANGPLLDADGKRVSLGVAHLANAAAAAASAGEKRKADAAWGEDHGGSGRTPVKKVPTKKPKLTEDDWDGDSGTNGRGSPASSRRTAGVPKRGGMHRADSSDAPMGRKLAKTNSRSGVNLDASGDWNKYGSEEGDWQGRGRSHSANPGTYEENSSGYVPSGLGRDIDQGGSHDPDQLEDPSAPRFSASGRPVRPSTRVGGRWGGEDDESESMGRNRGQRNRRDDMDDGDMDDMDGMPEGGDEGDEAEGEDPDDFNRFAEMEMSGHPPASDSPLGAPPNTGGGGEDETKYCVCWAVIYGEMIACDDDRCEREWVSSSSSIVSFHPADLHHSTYRP